MDYDQYLETVQQILSKSRGAVTIAFTGKDTNPLSKVSDMVLHVPSNNTQRVQECHILVGHIICGIIEESLKSHFHKIRKLKNPTERN